MPIWEDAVSTAPAPAPSFNQRVRAGGALPVLSNAAMFDLVFFGHDAFVRYYAEKTGYPFGLPASLAQIANYDRHANRETDFECKIFYLDCVKNHVYRAVRQAGTADDETLAEVRDEAERLGVSAFARRLGYPRFDRGRKDPLLVLADLPFKAYLTTSPFTFIEEALRRAGKNPVTKMCRWRGPAEAAEKELWHIPDTYRPSKEQPLVYHICGLDAHPETGVPLPGSLALSEDDQLELLVNIAQDRGKEGADRLPALVRGALFDDVILLGYSLNSWAFRALYYGLVRDTGHETGRRGVCSVQLSPDDREQQKKYLQNYLDREARFDIFWGDLYQYAEALMTS